MKKQDLQNYSDIINSQDEIENHAIKNKPKITYRDIIFDDESILTL